MDGSLWEKLHVQIHVLNSEIKLEAEHSLSICKLGKTVVKTVKTRPFFQGCQLFFLQPLNNTEKRIANDALKFLISFYQECFLGVIL